MNCYHQRLGLSLTTHWLFKKHHGLHSLSVKSSWTPPNPIFTSSSQELQYHLLNAVNSIYIKQVQHCGCKWLNGPTFFTICQSMIIWAIKTLCKKIFQLMVGVCHLISLYTLVTMMSFALNKFEMAILCHFNQFSSHGSQAISKCWKVTVVTVILVNCWNHWKNCK